MLNTGLPLGGQCAPTGGMPLSQKLGSWLVSAAVVAEASPTSVAALRTAQGMSTC